MTYDSSSLWNAAFIDERNDASKTEQDFFLGRYLAMREKASHLVSRIAADMPEMTVHNISHLDALWEMGSIVSENEVDLNPPEAFVFGAAILLHDAAMTLAAYPGGLEELKEQTVWRDSFARILEEQPGLEVAEVEYRATGEALRQLHARQAETLPMLGWQNGDGEAEFLIDDPEVRNFYGNRIGQIAHSHWWPVSKLEEEFHNALGPLGGRTTNKIDVLKIACLLRVADAMHLDMRRAPSFLAKLIKPKGISAQHWSFQEKMAVPYVENNALVFSASSPFDLTKAEAWWLGFDALTMVDSELRQVDNLLLQRGSVRLIANRVKGISSPRQLANYVATEKWTPVDTTLRVSDVPKIVDTLGGAKLYGNNPKVAIRELLQNAADAVRARRRLQDRDLSWGKVEIGLKIEKGEHLLFVEDNGVGMSSVVLTGPLIDFGNSFWRSSLAAEEFPGIHASGVVATGRYGIGFFSVFMLGALVRVISRRFDQASDTVKVLEFRDGLGSRPILYEADPKISPIDGGTRVEVLLERNPIEKDGFLSKKSMFSVEKAVLGKTDLAKMVGALAPALDVRIEATQYETGNSIVAMPSDWTVIPEGELLARIGERDEPPKSQAKSSRMRTLQDDSGNVYGRALLETDSLGSNGLGCLTIGGLRSSSLDFFRGVVAGNEQTASRNTALLDVPYDVMLSWLDEQVDLICSAKIRGASKALAAQVVLRLGGDIKELPIIRQDGEWLSESEFRTLLSKTEEILVRFKDDVTYDEDWDDVHPREFSDHFEENSLVFFVPNSLPGYRDRGGQDFILREYFDNHQSSNNVFTLAALIQSIVVDVWGDTFDEYTESRTVGEVLGTDIEREIEVFSRLNIN